MCLREKIGPDPRNFNQRVSLGRNDLLIRTFLNQAGSTARITQRRRREHRFSPVGRTMKSRSYHDRYYVGSHIEDQILENGKGSVQDATCV
jgi:hypothetical protein